jgi:hypothetical protein
MNAPRYSQPGKMSRPRGARLIETYSPKLGRRVSLYSRAAFELWLGLEADPDVIVFCERPATFDVNGREHVLDMWVQCESGEHFIKHTDDTTIPLEWNGLPVKRIADADLAATRMWSGNWERMMPVITLTRDYLTKQHLQDVRRHIGESMPLMRIERELGANDAMWLRGACYRLLADGVLMAPTLRTERLSLLTCFAPAP